MSTEQQRPIVAGVDGSASARQAVRWAAREAANRKAPLRLVHVCLLAPEQTQIALPRSVHAALADVGHRWLTEAAEQAKVVAPGITVATVLENSDVAPALVAESRSAQLVVLGSRGLGGFTELLVGSIAGTVAAHGECPVVVVRGADGDREPVLVGVDGSPACEAAIGFAFEEASHRAVPLIALHTWSDGIAASVFAMTPFGAMWPRAQAEQLRVLSARLAGWREKYPAVQVRLVVTRDRPAHSLIEQAREAQLVVVGSRGRGGVAGLVLGSTSRALLHHAPCPVAIVRPDPAQAPVESAGHSHPSR